MYLNITKATRDKPTANIFSGESRKAFLQRSGTRHGCLLSPIQHSRSPCQSNQVRNKKGQNLKEKCKIVSMCRRHDFY